MDTPVESTSEYVTQTDLSAWTQTLNDRFDALHSKVDDSMTTTHLAIEQARLANLTQATNMVEERLERERQQRRSELESFRTEWRDQYRELDAKLDAMGQGVSKITGLMESFQNVLQARDQKDQAAHLQLEQRIDSQTLALKMHGGHTQDLRTDLDALTTTYAAQAADIRTLRHTLHGNPANKDDAPSLFAVLNDLKGQVATGFTTVNANYETLRLSIDGNAAAIVALRQEREHEKALWQQRLKGLTTLTGWLQKIFATLLGRILLVTLIGGLSVFIFPELRATVAAGLESLFLFFFNLAAQS